MKKIILTLLGITIVLVIFGVIIVNTNTVLIKGTPKEQEWSVDDTLDLNDIYTFDLDDKDFKILLLSDIQIGSRKGLEVFDLIDSLVEDTNPDLIITLGDNTAGFWSHIYTKKLSEYLETLGIPWLVTFGNHDCEGIADRNYCADQYEFKENSLFQSGPASIQGVGNFVVNLENNEEHVYSLIMMDSNAKVKYGDGYDYDVIRENQIEWYEWQINQLSNAYNTNINSMLFFHIPLPEFQDAYNEFLEYTGTDSTIFGENNETISSPPENSGLFDSIVDLNSTTHIFVGHDHVNTLSYPYLGVQLTYGLKTGYNSYNDEEINGGTILTISTSGVTIEHLYK